ncbi:hypothetical protein FB446DRAFT_351647 [Lentinula raphanica]|nr:hypothetical protein FB446DRAFT_351647 [Lentinula raphanica]
MVHFRTIGILVIATMFIHAAPLDFGSLSAQNDALSRAPTSHSGGPTRSDLLQVQDGLEDDDDDEVSLLCNSSSTMKKCYVDVVRREEKEKKKDVHFPEDGVVTGYSKTPPPLPRTPSPTPEQKQTLEAAKQLQDLHKDLAAYLRSLQRTDGRGRVSKPKRRPSNSNPTSSGSST